ncbi:MAG: glycoside hydrolase [Verrucomicrobiae bacterium]|nr:glycoside hydrolase [Verrucomicrobiae bacterium]
MQPEVYHGWPTLTRRRRGDLWLVYSGGREAHVCPFGRVELMVSKDDGQTWGWPQVLLDTPIDDRDAGVLETPKGAMLVTTFTSLAYDTEAFRQALNSPPGALGAWPPERLQRWRAAHERVTAGQRMTLLGHWMIRTGDGGVTWSAVYPSLVNSPHGPFVLSNGHLLYAGKKLWTDKQRVGVCRSTDDGLSWEWLAEIPARPGDDYRQYHELHGVEAAPGRIIVHIRNHNPQNQMEILQTESADGGTTWSVPHPIGVWGLPSHLLRLRDGRLLMTYGYRRAPFGNQARLSEDAGKTWSAPLTISADGHHADLGYPSTVELPNGTLLTVWYELMAGSSRAVLRQARWQLPA